MPNRRRVFRSTRRGQRRRARIHYTKVVNNTSSIFRYNAGAGQWQRSTFGPQLPGGIANGGQQDGCAYFLNFNYVDIYNNATSDTKVELDSLDNLFSKRQLAGVRVSLIPRLNDIYINGSQDPSKAEALPVRNVNGTFYTIPYHDLLGNFTAPPTDGDFTRAHSDMPGARAHKLAYGGHHYLKPRAPLTSLSNSAIGGSGTPVIVGTMRAPWMSTTVDSSAVSLNQIWHSGLLILFPPNNVLQMYDFKLTFYVKYKSHY